MKWAFALLCCLLLENVKAQDQVLATGEWYKLSILQTGVYKINASTFRRMGVDASQIDPRTIKIYGKPGGMLPQVNSPGTALNESAIWVHGESDGKFDSDDILFFYAEGPHTVVYDSLKSELLHQVNTYSDTAFYFLTFGNAPGKRIAPAKLLSAPGRTKVSQFDDYWYHEKDATNILKSGREWWGEYLSGSTPLSFDVPLPGIVPGSEVKMRTSAIGAAQKTTRFVWHLNGKAIGEGELGTVSGSTYDVKALRKDVTYSTLAQTGDPAAFKVGVTYEKNGQSGALGYLNYIGLQTKRKLQSYDGQQQFYFLPQLKDTVTYDFQNALPGYNLWNVTDPANPSVVFQNAAGAEAFTVDNAEKWSRYIGFQIDRLLDVAGWRKVRNQHISGLDTPDLLILSPPAWESEARRLAAFREENDRITVSVATTSQIYNAYGGGQRDITAIRNFVRDLYNKNPGKLKYLLLFGDATYDYRNLLLNQTPAQRDNWVPVYESRESLNPVYTYSSDDYFGFMEPAEGGWPENQAGDHSLEIGIGRLPAKNIGEARAIVDKLIRYEGARSKGNWRNRIRFVADDGDGNIHQSHADQLAKLVQEDFLSSRIFVDEAEQADSPVGEKAPAINAAIRSSISDGTLILNYTGHGGVSGWAEEQVLTLADMQAARGIDNLPLLFTATCDFGRYDDPGVVSGAELMVLSPKGAAIGAISTTRPVYSSTNFTLSKAFYESLVDAGTEKRLGDLFRETKNNALVGSLNRNFTLLGDPSMKLVDRTLGIRWAAQPDTLRTLQTVTLRGEVFDQLTKKKAGTFDGTARVTIYDKQAVFQTKGVGGTAETYAEFRNKLFEGNVAVEQGTFTVSFKVTGEMTAGIGVGRASLYAINNDTTSQAAAQLDLVVGAKAMPGNPDKTPPKIIAYLNSERFKDGDKVDPSSVFYAKLSDENGINITPSANSRDITLTLNDTLVLVLNNYYAASAQDPGSGIVRFPFENLPAGEYLGRLKVWDTHTNSSEITFRFLVGSPHDIRLDHFKLYPNPFSELLSFELLHNRVSEDIELVFSVFLSSGQLLGCVKKQYYNSDEKIRETFGPGELGGWIPINIKLIYRVELRSLKDNTKDQQSGQLIRF